MQIKKEFHALVRMEFETVKAGGGIARYKISSVVEKDIKNGVPLDVFDAAVTTNHSSAACPLFLVVAVLNGLQLAPSVAIGGFLPFMGLR